LGCTACLAPSRFARGSCPRRYARLLIMDNSEHIAVACGKLVAELLAGCAHLTVLAINRTPLELDGEQVFAIPPLGGSPHGDLGQTDATDLFIDRAAVLASSYAFTAANADVIGRICRQVDGLPLAIELVASWIRVLSPRDLLSRIEAAMDAPRDEPWGGPGRPAPQHARRS
jgi:predicted ATPase